MDGGWFVQCDWCYRARNSPAPRGWRISDPVQQHDGRTEGLVACTGCLPEARRSYPRSRWHMLPKEATDARA